jgi:cell division septation protein DedD
MDSAMRDLDQLRERGEDGTRGRRLGLLMLACLLSLAALVAAFSLMGRDEAAEAPSIDPLAELMLGAPAGRPAANASAPEAFKPEALSFPSTLVERKPAAGSRAALQEDALLEDTVRAAAAEHAALSAGDDALPLDGLTPKSSAELPAARVATADNLRLSRLAQHDPLMASALPKRASGALAPPGSEGAYTLQVVSYDAREPAEAFAATLRSRGHKAFVAAAEVPGRGRSFRVRVGPFTTRREAESYQAQFELDEHMHSLVVSNLPK